MQQSRPSVSEALKAEQNTELLKAIGENKEESRKYAMRLIETGAPLKGALHKAVSVADSKMIEYLLQHNADPNECRAVNVGANTSIEPPISYAAMLTEWDCVKAFLNQKPIETNASNLGDALWDVANTHLSDETTALATRLITAGAKLNQQYRANGVARTSALHLAARHINLALVQLLLISNANPDLVDGNGRLALNKDAKPPNWDIVDLFIEFAKTPTVRNAVTTFVAYAIDENSERSKQTLTKMMVAKIQVKEAVPLPLHSAALRRNADALQWLFEHGVNEARVCPGGRNAYEFAKHLDAAHSREILAVYSEARKRAADRIKAQLAFFVFERYWNAAGSGCIKEYEKKEEREEKVDHKNKSNSVGKLPLVLLMKIFSFVLGTETAPKEKKYVYQDKVAEINELVVAQRARKEQEEKARVERETKQRQEAERLAQVAAERQAQRELEAKTLSEQINAFKKIYTALYKGQTSWFKSSNFLDSWRGVSDEQLKRTICAHIEANPGCRTSKAWALALRYHNVDLTNNLALFSEIYQYTFENSGLIKQSKLSGQTVYSSGFFRNGAHAITEQQMNNHQGARTVEIKRALRG